MNGETTASKVNRLLQKSRQAFRIYSSMSKSAKAEHNEYADMQAIEWKNINAELVRHLTHVVEKFSSKNLAIQIARMRDVLLSDYRRVEAELNVEHREILACAQRADFIRVAQLSRILISKKAFVQAAQAASHELSLIIDDKAAIHHDKFPSLGQLSQDRPFRVDSLSFGDQALAGEPSLAFVNDSESGHQIAGSHIEGGLEGSNLGGQPYSGQLYTTEEELPLPRLARVIPLRR